MLSAREFLRGTLQMYRDLQPFTRYGIPLPPLKAVINKLDHTNDAREIHHNLLRVLQHKQKEQELLVPTEILMTPVYASVAYRRAASLGLPVHRLDTSRARGRATLCRRNHADAGERTVPAVSRPSPSADGGIA